MGGALAEGENGAVGGAPAIVEDSGDIGWRCGWNSSHGKAGRRRRDLGVWGSTKVHNR